MAERAIPPRLSARQDGFLPRAANGELRSVRPEELHRKFVNLLDQPLAGAEFLAVDTETNGLARDLCEMTEVGAVLVGGGELHDTFDSIVRTERPLSRGIQRFTGITQGMVEAAPPPEEVLRELADLLHALQLQLEVLGADPGEAEEVVGVAPEPRVEVLDDLVDRDLHLLAGVPASHARARLTLLCAYDSSPRPLTQKILERPRLIERIRKSIPDSEAAYMTVFNSTPLERKLAVLLDVPLNGLDPELSYLGTKSGSRKVFKEAGIPHPGPMHRSARHFTSFASAGGGRY